MVHIHLDCVGGIAGDMFVAAMLDAFPHLEARVLADARKAVPPSAGIPLLQTGTSSAIACRRFALAPGLTKIGAKEQGGIGQLSRFADLCAHIQRAELSDATADEAIAILGHLARVEAGIHQMAVDDVHFHELSDWDSVLDVVAAGSIIASLKQASWSVSALPVGGGLVRTQHGLLPVPAPATAALLQGFVFRDDGVEGERVTPTGAAILRHLEPSQSLGGQGCLLATGIGAGTRTLRGMPNILRALVFEPARAGADEVTVLAFEVDDMTGEEIGVATTMLRALTGVADLTLTQAMGKKHRPATAFQLLVRPQDADQVADACFTHTSTIGLRRHTVMRQTLPRQSQGAKGERVKIVERPGGVSTVKAESDDLSGFSLAERRRHKLILEDRS